jgi:hypothetical protein
MQSVCLGYTIFPLLYKVHIEQFNTSLIIEHAAHRAMLTAALFAILFCQQTPQMRHQEQSVGVLDDVVIGFQE